MKGEGDLLISIYSRHWFPHRLITYTWDHRGNLLADGAFTYTYSAAGRMVRAESLTATLVYTYNADGLRVAQAQSVATVESVDLFTWDWAAGVPELLSDGDSLYLIGYNTLGWQNADDWTFVLPDALGSVRQETDATGAVIAIREWTPYGEEVGGAQAGLGFTGEWFDAAVEFTYLRARWYAPAVGIFSSPDPFPGLQTQPLSLHLYLYVLANPINAVDPSGWYGPEVHKDLTRQLVLEMAAIVTAVSDPARLADRIAEGDQYVDEAVGVLDSVFCRECHFCPYYKANRHVDEAIRSGNPFLFGASLHQLQDWYSHWNEGYQHQPEGHFFHSVLGGAYTGGRTWIQRQDFYWGWHVQPWPPYILPSPFPAHPREEVVRDIEYRNPGINLDGLSDNDLIDLYLRKDVADPNWPLRVRERGYFGLDTDRYFEGSMRDTSMEVDAKGYIQEFLIGIADPCKIDWHQPSDEEILALLTAEQ